MELLELAWPAMDSVTDKRGKGRILYSPSGVRRGPSLGAHPGGLCVVGYSRISDNALNPGKFARTAVAGSSLDQIL